MPLPLHVLQLIVKWYVIIGCQNVSWSVCTRACVRACVRVCVCVRACVVCVCVRARAPQQKQQSCKQTDRCVPVLLDDYIRPTLPLCSRTGNRCLYLAFLVNLNNDPVLRPGKGDAKQLAANHRTTTGHNLKPANLLPRSVKEEGNRGKTGDAERRGPDLEGLAGTRRHSQALAGTRRDSEVQAALTVAPG